MFGPGFEGEDLPPSSAGVACNGWRADARKIRGLRRRWWSTCITFSRGGKCCCHRRSSMIRSLRRSSVPIRRSARRSRRIAARFREDEFNFKVAFKEWALSPFYRADGLATATRIRIAGRSWRIWAWRGCSRRSRLERKVAAIFGKPWGTLEGLSMAMLYGGIDSEEVTERAADPSGAMGAIQRTGQRRGLQECALDFATPPERAQTFPEDRAGCAARCVAGSRCADPRSNRASS